MSTLFGTGPSPPAWRAAEVCSAWMMLAVSMLPRVSEGYDGFPTPNLFIKPSALFSGIITTFSRLSTGSMGIPSTATSPRPPPPPPPPPPPAPPPPGNPLFFGHLCLIYIYIYIYFFFFARGCVSLYFHKKTFTFGIFSWENPNFQIFLLEKHLFSAIFSLFS